jgi:hypothetical protein
MVPSDLIPSLALRRHTRHRAMRSGAPGASPFGSPKAGFSGFRINAYWRAASLSSLSGSGPEARNGLSLARNGCPFQGLHSGVKGPDLLLRLTANSFHSPFGLSAPRLRPVCIRPRCASSPRARCRFPSRHGQLRLLPPLPFGSFRSFRIKAFSRICGQPVRLPATPDLRSLPAA